MMLDNKREMMDEDDGRRSIGGGISSKHQENDLWSQESSI